MARAVPLATEARRGARASRLGAAGLLVLLGAAPALGACKRKPNDLSPAQLSRVVDTERPALKRCYDVALEQTPYKQEMRMEAVIHIASSGRVSAVELHGGGGLPGMGDCIRTAIRSWQFPGARDATDTSLPLIFHPEVTAPRPNLDSLRQALQQVGLKPAVKTR